MSSECRYPIPSYTELHANIFRFSSASGLGTPIRRGLSSISLVRWSPSGDYLLTAKLYELQL
jgi:CRISPR/Cas system CMR-associated protein Cmr1 (group 7 of RAMP superfamily)